MFPFKRRDEIKEYRDHFEFVVISIEISVS